MNVLVSLAQAKRSLGGVSVQILRIINAPRDTGVEQDKNNIGLFVCLFVSLLNV